ncbi:MAG: phosphatase PAP2-related protein [Candidatus Moranbacteria bacterium]|nr:phosphatase PAP2-related protein [Candidatus Moranbacteria bacterium]
MLELKNIFLKNKHFWKQKEVSRSIWLGILFFIGSIIINHFTSLYVDKSASSHVTDILLDNLPVVNVNFMVNEVVWIFIWFIFFLLIIKPQRIPYVLKNLALFIFIRSIFISLTHLGPIPDHSFLNRHDILSSIASGNDMFFSGHTGMPFLLALIFWENKILRYILIFFSVMFGVTMILGHLHYSIDVVAAFFITHSIYRIGKRLFYADYKLFHKAEMEKIKA